jgi:hypothetical protein
MTALHQYQRLEAAGLWRDSKDAQRREVIIGLRDATIVLTDPKTDMPLTQWSLPAIVRIGEMAGFVTFASAEDGLETLEIDDPAMIAAFDKLRHVIDRRRRRPGRLRGALMAGAVTAVIACAAIWLPLRLTSFTATRLPEAARAAIGALALADIQKTTGSACNAHMGLIAAQNLARRINAADPPSILVMRTGLPRPIALPGGMILLPADVVSAADGPDLLAGIVLAEMARARGHDPLADILNYAGFVASLRLLSSGALPNDALAGYGIALAAHDPAPLDPVLLQEAFAQAKISAQPYLDTANSFADMTDPLPNGSAPIVLEDADFLGLQYICDS